MFFDHTRAAGVFVIYLLVYEISENKKMAIPISEIAIIILLVLSDKQVVLS